MPSARSLTPLRLSKFAVATCGLLLILVGATAHAENIRVTAATDYWYHFDTTTDFSVRTREAQGYWSDPHLWLFNSEGTLVAANDDWYGLQSHIQITLQAGWYRLRAGVCCGNPDAWWGGVQYDLDTAFVDVIPTTVGQTTSTLLETTTSSTVEVWDTTTTTSTTLLSEPSTTQESLPESSTSSTTSSTTTSLTLPTSSTLTTTTTTTVPDTTTLPAETSTLPPESSSSTSSALTTTTESTVLPTPTTVSRSVVPTVTSGLPSTAPSVTTFASVPTPTAAVSRPDSTEIDQPALRPVATTVPFSQPVADAVAGLSEGASPEEVQAAIETIANNLDNLTATELDQIVTALSAAPDNVKAEFENTINIFSGQFDQYIPSGQTVSVAQRRALVAVGAVLAAGPLVINSRRK